MRPLAATALAVLGLVIAPGCKKKGGSPGPGPGGWLVGDEGLMAAITPGGALGTPYELGTAVDLAGIACRGTTDAFVVGEAGTFLRTFDGGASWEAVDVGTSAHLRAVAADAGGSVLVAGDDGLWLSHDSGARFAAIASGRFVSVAMADADLALALDDAGTVVRVDATGAHEVTDIAGARAVSLSHGGSEAAVVGEGGVLARSRDGGATWQTLAAQTTTLNAAWIAADGALLAVGDDGAFARLEDELEALTLSDASLHALHLDASGAGMAAGADGTVLVTDDAGDSWRALDLPIASTIRGLDQLDGHGHW